jgi:hypothetical protein
VEPEIILHMQEKIEVEHRGDVYTGQYSVEGINMRRLVVYYNGRNRLDTFDSRLEDTGFVECLAERLLLEMVIEETAEFE